MLLMSRAGGRENSRTAVENTLVLVLSQAPSFNPWQKGKFRGLEISLMSITSKMSRIHYWKQEKHFLVSYTMLPKQKLLS